MRLPIGTKGCGEEEAGGGYGGVDLGRRRRPWRGWWRCGIATCVVTWIGTWGSVTWARAGDWETGKNRVMLNSHIGFNLKADFKHLGGVRGQTGIGLAEQGVDHIYDDGFNRVDAGGNAGGQTWYWGYESSSQISGSDLLLSSTSAAGSGSVNGVTDAPHWGMELTYARQLGWNGSYWWGVEVGLSWTDLSFSERGTTSGDVVRTVDAYALGGITPPGAPYSGTFEGPGPVISDEPRRTAQLLSNAAMTSGSYQLEASLYALRLGLIYETPFTEVFTFQFGGGVIGALVRSEFGFRESTSVPGLGTFSETGSDHESEFLGGAYGQAGLALHLSRNAMASLGLQYNYLGSYSQEVGGREARLDLKSSFFVALGVGVSF